jgi:hypothetical protein
MNENVDLFLEAQGDKQTDTTWSEVCYTIEVQVEFGPKKMIWRWARSYLGLDRRFHTFAEAQASAKKFKKMKGVVQTNFRVVQVETTYRVVTNI